MPAAVPVDPVSAALTAGQAILGTTQAIIGSERSKRLLQQRRAYQTPEEYYKILQQTMSTAGQGYDPFTLSYLTGKTDQAFSSTLGTAERLGANPNDLSGIFDAKVNSIMKIGAENHALNMENIGKYINALDLIGQNKAAEQKSQQDLIKDQQQAAAADKQAGLQNIFGAANTFLAGYATDKANQLFAPKNGTVTQPGGPSYSAVSATGDINVPTAANPSGAVTSTAGVNAGAQSAAQAAANAIAGARGIGGQSPALENLLSSLTPEQMQQFLAIYSKPQ